ncbi:hypothetical protein N7478_001432 [Penicillium angulare]|uniref:uncharacterized protein n=1 Tax=Penicillium angulare TaxID=116970 RepID=UPI0025402A26|nr:uncharacterized protein N7478_001432 [Penicillium angulare]KAJ5292181.1 hypothetical protein N7478_001432 [Penicillium angulare]
MTSNRKPTSDGNHGADTPNQAVDAVPNLNYEFIIEWKEYSPSGEPYQAVNYTHCEFQDGELICIHGRLLRKPQTNAIGRTIQRNPKMGSIGVIMGHEAFSIRIAALRNGRVHVLDANGWEDVPDFIKKNIV